MKKGKIHNLFASKYEINFFYKPTMIEDDDTFVIMLDNKIVLSMRVYDGVVMVIKDIKPITKAYIANFYNDLLLFLNEQTVFTVLISKHTNTQAIWEYCHEVPTIEDMRFLQVSLSLYKRYVDFYNGDISEYGFYLVAVTDELSKVNGEVKKEVKVVEVPKEPAPVIPPQEEILNDTVMNLLQEFLIKKNPHNKVVIGDLPEEYNVTIQDIHFIMKSIGDAIYITHIEKTDISNIYYLAIFEQLEEFIDIADIYLESLTNQVVYTICKAREYTKIMNLEGKGNSFGTYKLKRYKR